MNEFGREWQLGVVRDDQAGPVLEDQVHLVLAGMGDLDLDEAGFGDGPGLGGFWCRHSRKMKATWTPCQLSLEVVFPTLTNKRESLADLWLQLKS